MTTLSSLVAQMLKNLPAMQETWVGKLLWRREWQPTLVFLPREFHEQRSLAGHSPWDSKSQDTFTNQTTTAIRELMLDFVERQIFSGDFSETLSLFYHFFFWIQKYQLTVIFYKYHRIFFWLSSFLLRSQLSLWYYFENKVFFFLFMPLIPNSFDRLSLGVVFFLFVLPGIS